MIPEKSPSLTPPVGVIDSLASGLETVATYPLLLLVPLVMDLFLWLGPRVSFRLLLEWPAEVLTGSASPFSELLLNPSMMLLFVFILMGSPTLSHQEILSSFNFAGENQTDPLKIADALSKSAHSIPDQYLNVPIMPSITAGNDAASLPFGYMPPIWQIQTPGEAMILRLSLFLAGLLLMLLYMAVVAQRVKEGTNNLGWLFKRVPVVIAQVVGVLILLLAIGMAGLLAMGLVFTAVGLLGNLIGGGVLVEFLSLIFSSLLFFVIVWLALLMVFTIHGMYMNDRNVFAAMWDSLRVVQWNVPSTLGLMLLIMIIATAMQYARGWLDFGSWLIPVGIVVNAFISTGLLAATFVFFKDRFRYWQQLREALLAELERRRTQQNKA